MHTLSRRQTMFKAIDDGKVNLKTITDQAGYMSLNFAGSARMMFFMGEVFLCGAALGIIAKDKFAASFFVGFTIYSVAFSAHLKSRENDFAAIENKARDKLKSEPAL